MSDSVNRWFVPPRDLNALVDVEIVSPINAQHLEYESATNLWKNKTPSGGGGDTKVELFENAIQIGTVARRLNMVDVDDFILAENIPNDWFDVTINRNAANGIAGLDASSKVLIAQIPDLPTLGTPPASPRQTAITNAELAGSIAFNKLVALTASRATESNGSGEIIASAILSSELASLSGVSANIQTQIDGKEPNLGFTPENVANKDAASGYAGLTAGTLLLLAQIPNLPASRTTSGKFTLPRLPIGSAFQRYRTNSGATDIENFTEEAAFEFVIDGGGSVITTGIKGHIRIPFACVITRWTLLADASGSIVIDVNRFTSLANFDADTKASITGTDTPDLVADRGDESTALTGWTTVMNQGDILEFEVDSVATIQRVTISLRVNKRG